MKLIIGGFSQGKTEYVKNTYGDKDSCFIDGEMLAEAFLSKDEDCMDGLNKEITSGKRIVVNHVHLLIKMMVQKEKDPRDILDHVTKLCPDCIFISDEIGNGIVPIDAFEREYREKTGRILTELAGKSDEVVRVICGLGQKIK